MASSTAGTSPVAPSDRSRSASSAAGAMSTPTIRSSMALPSATRRPSIAADDALAGDGVEVGRVAQARAARLRLGDDGGGQRMLARPLQAGRQAQHRGLVEPGCGAITVTRGLPSVRVPVLSTTRVSTFSSRSSASAFLISTPAWAPRPTPTMIDIGVAEPEGAGAGDDQHADRGDQRIGQARLGPEQQPGDEGDDGDDDDGRHEPGRDLVGQPLDRRAAALRLADHLHDLRQQRLAPTFSACMTRLPRAVERAADHLVAGTLFDRQRIRRSPSIRRRRLAFQHASRRPAPSRRDARAGGRRPGSARAARPHRRRRRPAGAPSSAPARAVRARRRWCARARRSSSTCPSSTSTVITAAASK